MESAEMVTACLKLDNALHLYFLQYVIKKQVARWAVMFFIGVFTGLVACGIDIVIEEVTNLKFDLVKQCILGQFISSVQQLTHRSPSIYSCCRCDHPDNVVVLLPWITVHCHEWCDEYLWVSFCGLASLTSQSIWASLSLSLSPSLSLSHTHTQTTQKKI